MAESDYLQERANELHLQVIRHRVLQMETELLRRATHYIPQEGDTPETRSAFLVAIKDLLLDLGHEDWITQIPDLQYANHTTTKAYVPH